jgi:hypothetical protein
MTASVFPGSSLCWTRDSLHQVTLDYDSFPADMMFGVLSVRREGEPEPFFTLPVRDRPLNDNFPMPTTIASTICGPNAPELVARDVYCATLAAYDASGNVAGGDAEVCAVAQACAETDLLSAACEPAPDEPASSGGCALSQRPGGRQATIVLLLFAIALRRRRSRA